jgi:hypothetical protein
MGAEIVIAVDLASDILGRHLHTNPAGVAARRPAWWTQGKRNWASKSLKQ